MKTRMTPLLCSLGLVGLFNSSGVIAEEQNTTGSSSETPAQMGGMQHSMGGMQHGGGTTSNAQTDGMGGMQHGGMGGVSGQSQTGMAGMQHGGMGGGMMGGMGGGMMGSMSDKDEEEAWQKLQAQDIRLDELRRQIREANDQAARDKLKGEHRAALKEQVDLTHKLMMQIHMKSMKSGGMSTNGPSTPATTPPAAP